MAILIFIIGLVLFFWALNIKTSTILPHETMTSIKYTPEKKKKTIKILMLIASISLILFAVILLIAGFFIVG